MANSEMTEGDRLRLRDARAILQRNNELNMAHSRRLDEIDEAHQRRVEEGRRESTIQRTQAQAHARKRGASAIDSCRALFGRGKIAKKMTRTEREKAAALTDPVVAARVAARNTWENNRAVAVMLNRNEDRNAPPVPSVQEGAARTRAVDEASAGIIPTPAQASAGPPPNTTNGEWNEVGSECDTDEDAGNADKEHVEEE